MRSLDVCRIDRRLPFSTGNTKIFVSGIDLGGIQNFTLEIDAYRQQPVAYIDLIMLDKDPQAAIDSGVITVLTNDVPGGTTTFDFIDDEVYGHEKVKGVSIAKMSFPVNMTLRTNSN